MIIRTARAVLNAMQAQIDWYGRYASIKRAEEVKDSLYEGLTQVGTRYSAPVGRGLPFEYRRQKAGPCYLFYLKEGGIAYVYLLRGQRQRSLPPRDHKMLATKAKRDNIELS